MTAEHKDLPNDVQLLLKELIGPPEYLITVPIEIQQIVSSVEKSRQSCTLAVIRNQDSKPTLEYYFNSNIFSCNIKDNTMEFDLPISGPQFGRNQTLRGVAKLNGVVITFETTTQATRQIDAGKTLVLVAKIPHKMCRLQRRNNFRIAVPSDRPIHAHLKIGAPHLENLPAIDISCGGISVLALGHAKDYPAGSLYSNCKISFKEDDELLIYHSDIAIRHTQTASSKWHHLYKPVGAKKPPGINPLPFKPPIGQEFLQVGLEFRKVPANLERNMARLVNEFASLQLQKKLMDD